MTPGAQPQPVRVTPFPNGQIGIVWSDGRETWHPGRALRCACACATCVDEMTGRKVLDDSAVPEDIRPLEIHAVGNYGISIRWSDGHDTGIYPHERLREMGRPAGPGRSCCGSTPRGGGR